ncbi:hypothetical protein DNTS_001136 [Danionella cerebrum]|uniref:Uncharacterized protein n=1 Tax=Danionella cerebrum TaxID=2873325 RepID=A0A553QBH3_9TELE|nr:hypothetical protein DNTS_001136 [Danionella translucida]
MLRLKEACRWRLVKSEVWRSFDHMYNQNDEAVVLVKCHAVKILRIFQCHGIPSAVVRKT